MSSMGWKRLCRKIQRLCQIQLPDRIFSYVPRLMKDSCLRQQLLHQWPHPQALRCFEAYLASGSVEQSLLKLDSIQTIVDESIRSLVGAYGEHFQLTMKLLATCLQLSFNQVQEIQYFAMQHVIHEHSNTIQIIDGPSKQWNSNQQRQWLDLLHLVVYQQLNSLQNSVSARQSVRPKPAGWLQWPLVSTINTKQNAPTMPMKHLEDCSIMKPTKAITHLQNMWLHTTPR